jgi:hypothetical protein
MPSLVGWVALPVRQACVAEFGVGQPRCRISHAHDQAQARVTPFTLLVTGIWCVLVTIMESVSIEITSSNPITHRWESGLPSRNITQVRYESTESSTNNICMHPTQSSYRHLKQPAY